MKLSHKFVTSIPEQLDDGVIYISVEYATAIHKCCCGCGNEVVTPFSPKDWHLTFDGISVTLSPSIGNENFECRSHYWIKGSEIKWLPPMNRRDDLRTSKRDEWGEATYPASQVRSIRHGVKCRITELLSNWFKRL